MRKFILTNDLIDIDRHINFLNDDTIVVHSDYYDIKTEYNKIPWSKFKITYNTYNQKNIVYVGMNRIRTANNRYDLVHKFVHNLSKYDVKITIDDKPFNKEPWRLWYHFGFLFGKWMGISYSNPIETDWKKWFNLEKNDCIIKHDNIRPFIKNVYSELTPLSTTFTFYELREKNINWYEELKKFLFENNDTIGLIINKLLKECNKKFNLNISYESYLTNINFSLPNLGIYRFIAQENLKRLKIYNEVVSYEGI
jgi:hypothetical protein